MQKTNKKVSYEQQFNPNATLFKSRTFKSDTSFHLLIYFISLAKIRNNLTDKLI